MESTKTYRFNNKHNTIVSDYCGSSAAQYCLVLLHGLASNASRWHEFMHHSSLTDQFELFAMDLRGHGRSMIFERYTRDDWINDVHQLLVKRQKASFLIGHSLGAQVALDYASLAGHEQNARLKGLVLIDPVFPQALDGILKKVARFRSVIKVMCWLLRGLYAVGLHRRHYPYRDLHALDKETREFLAANPHKSIADLYMNPFSDLAYIPLANYLQDLYEVTRPLKPLDSIKVPVLVLLSEGASTSHVELNKQILTNIPNLEIMTINADHWLLTEQPIKARETIEQWCKQQIKL